MSRTTRSGDLAPQASGYIYRSDNNGPISVIKLGPGIVHKHLNTIPEMSLEKSYASHGPFLAPFVTNNLYATPSSYIGYPHPSQIKSELTSQKEDEDGEYNSAEDDDESDESDDDESDEIYDSEDAVESDESNLNDDEIVNDHIAENKSDYNKADGSSHNSEHKSSHGDSGDKGYKSHKASEESLKKNYHQTGDKNYYKDGAGFNTGHVDAANYYSGNHAGSRGYKGGEFSQKVGHNKGSKTTGFHKVYHKDEYKKDNEFYDDAHNSGHFKKHANEGSNHQSAEGGQKSGKKYDLAYDHSDRGKEGFSNQERVDAVDKQYIAKAGNEGFYNKHQKYDKNSESVSKSDEY